MTRSLARGTSFWRDLPLVLWLVAAIVVSVIHRWLPDASWLMLHLVLLGAASHAILVWSFHFAQTVLRAPATEAGSRQQIVRLGLLAAGTALVLVGVPATWWPVTLGGATLVAVAVGWHALALRRMLRSALPARFKVTVRYYLAAAACLLVGITLGVITAWGWDDAWHGRLLVGGERGQPGGSSVGAGLLGIAGSGDDGRDSRLVDDPPQGERGGGSRLGDGAAQLPDRLEAHLVRDAGEGLADVERLAAAVVGAVVVRRERRRLVVAARQQP